MQAPVPAGYRQADGPRGERIVALRAIADEIVSLVAARTLHQHASSWGGAAFQGRGTAFEFQLGDLRAVVRHNRHGGALAPLTGDLFFGDGRTPIELDASERLRAAGVATPRVLAAVTYPAGFGLSRSDVATELIPNGRDLGEYLCDADPAIRVRAVAAAGALLDSLAAAGAWHQDLNAKNILLHAVRDRFEPYLLDVDRVTFHTPHDPLVMQRNVERLVRSARKWRRLHGARVTDAELSGWQDRCRDASTPRPPRPN